MRHIDYIILNRPGKVPYLKYIIVSSALGALAFGAQIITYVIAQMIIDQGTDEQKYLANLL